MAYNCNILLGRITKVSGFKGAVTVKLDNKITGDIPEPESVFLEIEGKPVPFFIASYDYRGADLLTLAFDGYETAEKVTEFVGCRVFLTESESDISCSDNQLTLKGFSLFSSEGRDYGIIRDLIAYPGQVMLSVISKSGSEILIPYHDDLVVKLNKKQKCLYMNIPEGIEDLN